MDKAWIVHEKYLNFSQQKSEKMKDGFLFFDEIVKCIVDIMKIDGGGK